ncbi:MAG: acetoacetate decarboxylase, partial [Leptospira sp.]|nr:acetoacetate decarboxylase [Leptospira sp.]
EIEKHFFSFPVTTGIFPITLLQKSKTGFLSTRFIGKGSGKIATISSFKSDPNFFPDILQCAKWKIPGIGIRPFELIFPVPDKIN